MKTYRSTRRIVNSGSVNRQDRLSKLLKHKKGGNKLSLPAYHYQLFRSYPVHRPALISDRLYR